MYDVHILQSTGSFDRRLSPTSCEVVGQRKQNLNLNQNVQMISVERRNEGPRVAMVTRGGDRIGTDRTNEGK
jgi:hypothetical protein